jgi:uncharacterized repeat protein (TIGR01451 family)
VSATVPQYTTVFSDEDSGALCNGFVNSCGPGETLTWTVPSLAAGESRSVMFAATVATGSGTPPDGKLLRTEARVRSALPGEVSASAQVVVDATPTVSLGMVESADPVLPGSVLSYAIELGNLGGTVSPSGVLKMELAEGTTFVSATGGGSHASGVVQWNVSGIAAGASNRYQVFVQTAPGLQGGDLLEAGLEFGVGAASIARAEVVTSVVAAAPGATVEVSASPDPVRPGEKLWVTVTFANRTAAQVNNWTVSATVPQYTTVFSDEDSGALCNGFVNSCGPGETLTWTVPSLAAGESRSVMFAATVATGSGTPLDGTVLRTTAKATSDLPGEVSGSADVVVDSTPSVDLSVVESADPVVAGESLTYVLLLGNRGSVPSPAGVLTLRLPQGTTFVLASDGGTHATGIVQWNVSGIAAGASNRYEVVVQTSSAATAGDLLEADAEFSVGVASLARAQTATSVVGVPSGTTLLVTGAPDPVRPGERVWFTVTFANRTAAQVNNWTVSATVPQYTTVLSDEDSGALCNGFVNSCGPGGTLTWTVPSLAAGESRSVMFAATVAIGSGTPPDGTVLRTSAKVTSDLAGEVSAIADVLVDASPQMTLGIVESRDPAVVGEPIAYTLALANRGTLASDPGTLTLALPSGTTFVSATGGGSLAGNVVQWSVGSLAAGTGYSYQVVLQVGAGALAAGVIEAAADFSTGAASLARADVATAVAATPPGAVVTMTAAPDPVKPAERVTFTVTFQNQTLAPVNNWTVAATVPQYTTVLAGEDSGALCNGFDNSCGAGGTLTWAVPTLTAGESRVVTFAALVNGGSSAPPNGTLLSSTATVTSDLPGEVSAGAEVIASTVPPPPPPGDVALVSAASRKVHGAAGTFDLPLVLTTASPTTEPRTGGAGGNHTIVFVFDQPVTSGTAAVTAGTGTAGTPTFSGNAMSVPLAGVVNQQYVTVAVSGLNGTAAGASVRIGFLLGDVSQNRVVTVSDLAQVNTQIAQVVTASNYLRDVNASGTLTVADKGIANTQITKALPAP